jgi:hypothetical protein
MSTKEASVQFRYGVICDDVRREDNGKLLIIGVYSGYIIVQQLPATLLLSLVIAAEVDSSYEIPIELRVKFNKRVIRTGKGTIRMERAGLGLTMAKGLLLDDLKESGLLTFQARPSQGRWATLCTAFLEPKAG